VLYIGWLQYVEYDVARLEQQARSLQGSYTNAMRLKAQMQVMEDQLNLQFAALRCYKALSEKLPQALTLESMSFQGGKTLTLSGNGDANSQPALNDFTAELRRYSSDGQLLFSHVPAPTISIRGTTLAWNFQCELRSTETE
jgi:hypothetical protein